MAQRRVHFFIRFLQGTLSFLVTQLCLTLISWPIMLWWGLPVASLSPLGNYVFGPFLTGFLVLSVVLFLLQLCTIPLFPFSWLMDTLVVWWLKVMEWQPWDWYVTFRKPPLMIALLIPLVTMAIMHFRPLKTSWQKLCALSAWFCLASLLLALLPLPEKIEVPCGCGKVILKNTDKGIIAIDTGGARRTQSADNWAMYKLLPELVASFGVRKIDQYYLCRITPSAVAFVKILLKKGMVRHLSISHHIDRQKSEHVALLQDLMAEAAAQGVLTS